MIKKTTKKRERNAAPTPTPAPSKPPIRVGKNSSSPEIQSVGGDFVEIEIVVKACVAYQTVGAAYKWRTSDPNLIPQHGASTEEIKKSIRGICDTVTDVASDQVDDIYGATLNLADKAAKDRGAY